MVGQLLCTTPWLTVTFAWEVTGLPPAEPMQLAVTVYTLSVVWLEFAGRLTWKLLSPVQLPLHKLVPPGKDPPAAPLMLPVHDVAFTTWKLRVDVPPVLLIVVGDAASWLAGPKLTALVDVPPPQPVPVELVAVA